MKYFYSEAQNNYTNYVFSYQVLLLKEKSDSVDEVYAKGFLPFRSIKDLYYLARSCRVNMTNFMLSSENKRVLKKMEQVAMKRMPIAEYKVDTEKSLARDYLTDVSVKRIFSSKGNYTDIISFGDRGVVVTKMTEELVHYVHQFYEDKTFGMAGMTSLVNFTKESKRKFIYLGTCYGESSLYKAQSKGFEFFDGISWADDLEKLKFLVKNDGKAKDKHLFQEEAYLEKFYGVEKLGRLVKKLQND